MNLIQSLKWRYGLSQYQLAQLTGVTRSHLSLVALEIRQLPNEATDVLIALHEAFDDEMPLVELHGIETEFQSTHQFLATELEKHAHYCLDEADRLEMEYNELQSAIERAWRRLHGFRVFRAGYLPIRRTGDLFLQIQEDRLDTVLNPQSLFKAEMLGLRFEMLRMEAGKTRERLENLKI